MFASGLIIVLCSGLLAYWFRYSCILLLRHSADHAGVISPAMQGTFKSAAIQDGLENDAPLDPLHDLLKRDYQVLTYLVRHSSRVKLESFEERLLVWDYQVMQFWYGVTKTAAPEQARQALREMAAVLTVLSLRIGERAGVAAEA
jgi:hypothetical protein